jgi:gliding motility-associated-like protein
LVNHFKAVSRNKGALIIIGYSLSIVFAYAQNLVVNGSFEQAVKDPCRYIFDPTKETLRDYFANWTTPTGGTADPWFYNDALLKDCTQNLKEFSVQPHSGKRCAGIYTSANKSRSPTREPTYREYLQTRLKQPLQIGKLYSVELYYRRNPYSGTHANNLGFYFSVNPITQPNTFISNLAVTPQINQSQLLTGDTSWVKLSGCFTAEDAFEYVTIGNFYDDSQTLLQIAPLPNRDGYPYYLIDDVTVEENAIQQLPMPNFLGADTTLCPNQALYLGLPAIPGVLYHLPNGTPLTNYSISKNGLYQVEAKAGSCLIKDSIRVTIEKGFQLPADTTLCLGESLVLTLDPADSRYEWSNGSHDSILRVSQTGVYWVSIPSPHCQLSDTIYVKMIDCSAFVPNVITPNGDGLNDSFAVSSNADVNRKWHLEIFNRWGTKIYQSASYQNDWTAPESPVGVYYYLLYDSIHRQSYKGWLTVIR